MIHEEHCEHCHEHGEHHHHEEGGTKETFIKIIIATVLLIAAIIIEKKTDWPTWAYLLIYLIPYLIVGWETLHEAVEALFHGEALDENFLMTVATVGTLTGRSSGRRLSRADSLTIPSARNSWQNW